MARRGTVVTYGRRHQLRQVHADADNWGSVFDKEEKDTIFGSSFSSGQDSSAKLSDSSTDFSTRKPKRCDKTSKTNQKDKENAVQTQPTRKTRRRKSCIYNISCGSSNTSSEFDGSTSKTRPLRERNTNTKVAAKPPKGKKVANKRKTRKKDKEDEPVVNHHSRLFDVSERAEPKAAHYDQHFTEFEDFSLCIEVEEEIEEDRVVVNVPPNLTPSGSSDNNSKSSLHSVQHSTPNLHTSTPQLGRDVKQDLFRRLTKSNLAKLAASGGMSPRCSLTLPGANGSILGAVSPAFSNISHRRESMESDFGTDFQVMNTTRDSGVNHMSASSLMVTTRRRKPQSQNSSNMFSMSSVYSPAPPVPFTPIAEDAGAETRDLHDMSVDQDHEVDKCEEQLSELNISSAESHPSQQDSKSKEVVETEDLYQSAKDFSHESEHLHPDPLLEQDESSSRHSESDGDGVDSNATQSYIEDVLSLSDNNGTQSDIEDIECEEYSSKVPSNLQTPALLRGCGVVLDRLPDSVVSQYTQPASSDYDASRSLFDEIDLHLSPALGVNKSTDYETAEDKSPVANLCQNNQLYASSEGTSDGEVDEEDYSSAKDVLSDDRRSLLSRIDEFEESYRSLKVLTPLKSRSSGRVLPPRSKVLLQCDQEEPMTFNDCIPPNMMKKCVKIGEGVYGEVYRSENRKASVALKIIPIEGDFPVNDEPQKTFAEILTEIVISQTLSDLNEEGSYSTQNYVQVHSCSVVQGAYPDTLIKGWDRFHAAKISENDRPDAFPDTQLFIIFEFADSGCDLEGFKFESLIEAKSVLVQVVLSLAVAESALGFEHRDLHWGNVLVKRTTEKTLDYTFDDQEIEIRTQGIRVAIIDFTLSRLRKDGCTVSSDLSLDPTLFEGEGDYQFDIYRLMKEENENNWEPFHPYSNVLWIHYLADKLLRGKVYAQASTKAHKAMCRHFRTLMREALDYQSAGHLISSCSFFTEEFINP